MATKIYGREIETDSLLSIELLAFRQGWTVESGGRGRTEHFIRACKELWPASIWHEWAYEMASALCEYDVSGFTSGASSGKSEMLAKFAIVSWFADPVHTLVIACSTTAVDAKQKVWGHIVRNFREARAAKKSVGTLIESMSIIRLSEKSDGIAASDNSSICLVAAGDAFKDDALKRLQGRHQKNVLLILDELQDCSQEIITTALGNLSANEHFEVHAAGNAAKRFDAHALFLTPILGWNSINRFTHRWEIRASGKRGIAIHFDATSDDSPNMKRMASGLPQIPFLRKAEESIAAKLHYGDQNPIFLRSYVGFWADADGESDFLVTDQALASHEAYDKPEWKTAPTPVDGLDPSYSTEGDRFICARLNYGMTTHGIWTIAYSEGVHVKPVPIKGETKDDANLRECKRLAEDRDVGPRNIGIDSSGGNPLLSIAHRNWSPDILGVPFGGAASDLPLSQFDKRLACDVYANGVSELWGVFVEFLNAGQIRGITPALAKELMARKYELVAGGKIKVEKKSEVKKRLGFSPDLADAFMVGLRVIRERLKVVAGASTPAAARTSGNWKALMKKSDVVSNSARDFSQRLRVRLG